MSVIEQHAFLDLAKNYNWAGVKQAIVDNPTLVNVQPGGRWSALHQAARSGSTEAVEMLLASGANPLAKNSDSKTPREVASQVDILQVLAIAETPEPDPPAVSSAAAPAAGGFSFGGAAASSGAAFAGAASAAAKPRLREIKLAKTGTQELGAVILTVAGVGGSSYDEMFTTTPQQGPNGTRVAVYQAEFSDLANICAHLRASAGGPAAEIYRQLARDVNAVNASSFCLNLECCGCCSERGFDGLTTAEKDSLWSLINFVVSRGSFTMASDFSLKALISDWRPDVLGPNPFVQLQHGAGCGFNAGGGGCNSSFKLEFDPPTLSGCPSAQLATVGELCVDGEANVHAMGGTIVYSLNKDMTSEVQSAGSVVEVLTVATKIDGMKVTQQGNAALCETSNGTHKGFAGHVLLTRPSGGRLLASMGHWAELANLNTTEEAIFAAVDRRGAEYSADFRRRYVATDVKQRARFRSECSAALVQGSAPCTYDQR